MARHSAGISPSVSLVLASAFWAVATVFSKQLLASVPPITFLVIQLAPSVLALWLLVAAKGVRPTHWRGFLPLALIGLLNPGLSYTLSMLGLVRTTASVATLLWAAEPALIVAMAWLVLREVITPRLVLLTATAACGVLLVSGLLNLEATEIGNRYGAMLILGGVLCCAIYTILSRKIGLGVDPLLTVAIQQTAGLIWSVAIWPFELRGNGVDSILTLTQSEVLGGALSGLMYYAAAFWLYLNGLRRVPASTASMFINLTPLFGVAAAYALLGERLTPAQCFGAIVILLSVVMLLKSQSSSTIPEATCGD
ncbi:DMT family transporter [Hyphomicrobium sp.]|uniref:DMT family transporter n=1 Tax=Hyphomicrobium sp. TaxID=82 RepID=UPI001DDE89EB|nr:DMT family transporter [Hyphomicrobium sp.]MBY0560111.1 DMT family transporter [Hyphomicrobium sp.]